MGQDLLERKVLIVQTLAYSHQKSQYFLRSLVVFATTPFEIDCHAYMQSLEITIQWKCGTLAKTSSMEEIRYD